MKFTTLSFSLLVLLSVSNSSYIPYVVRQDTCEFDFRAFDGTCNARDDLGAANQPQLRVLPRRGAGNGRPNARAISNAVFAQDESIPNDRGMSELVTFFAQFIDHDLTLVPEVEGQDFPIAVPEGDEVLEGIEEIPFIRSLQRDNSPVNSITSFIDGSVIYGSDDARATALREGQDGLLRVSARRLLPFNDDGISNSLSTSREFFIAGDIRSNENPMLTALHTMFVREHNIIADELRREFGDFNDTELFLNARKINVAQLQKIVYQEWLPALLGEDTGIPEFSGFNEDVEPVVSAFFSTAAFRVGHTLLNNQVTRLNRRGRPLGALLLNETFFETSFFRDGNIGVFIRGMANTPAQEVDAKVVDGVRNFLFTNRVEEFESLEGRDLVARNIQRGRDHRIPSYNRARRDLGLAPRGFNRITSDQTVRDALRSVYDRRGQIDAFVGALAEDHVEGSSFGELLRTVWAAEFTRLRDGDKFFYLNDGIFSEELQALPRVERIFDNDVSTMREIVLETTNIRRNEIPSNVFFSNS